MDGDEINLKDIYNIDIDYSAAQTLENLNNKYNINKTSNTNIRKTKRNINTSSSQHSLHRINSDTSESNKSDSSSATSSNYQSSHIDVTSKKFEENPIKNNRNKSKYENVTSIIDSDVLSIYGQQLLNELENLEIKYEVKSQIHSNLITWVYVDQTNSDNDANIVLLILNWKDVISYISSSSLIKHIKSLLEIIPNHRISLGLYGFQNYFKYWKTQKQSDLQGKVNDKKYSEYKNSFKISRQELEYAFTELELRCSCSHRFLENVQDMANMIGQYTKSIGQLPEKLEQQEKYKNVDFYMMKDNRDCVMVDKYGNGFKRLWQQQLTTFDLVRLETAEAIMSKYPTPSILFDAYKECQIKSDGVKLLEDLPIRRAAGPLTSSRKLGPELSNKIYNFVQAAEGSTVL